MPDTPVDNPYLLAPLNGEVPPRSAWFEAALAEEPARSRYDSEGAQIELLTWGEVGRPGLLLLHGMGAHADWWSFIAPSLAMQYRVAAISWPGMGRSDWRETYELPQLGRDVMRAVELAELDKGPVAPILIGHSFGGMPLLQAAADNPTRVTGGILIDSFIPRVPRQNSWAAGRESMPVYPTLAAALARYKFAPVQTAEHLDIVDHMARASLKEVEGGWTWRFDPNLWAKLDRSNAASLFDRVEVPIGLLFGERSTLVSAESIAEMQERLPWCPFAASIPDAAHHVMVDQPIALISALRVAAGALWTLRREQ